MLEEFTRSEKETMLFAKKFARAIEAPSIIILEGDLGAGKTHFVKGFAEGKKCKTTVTSPTFTIMNLYEGKKCNVYHFDMYRLNSPEEVENLGFDEYFDKKLLDGVTLVEWPEKAGELAKDWDYNVTITKLAGENDRQITVTKRGETC